ncbi:MAG: hypothetical protein JSV15_04475, partial [Candidatus Bathyarchaeota archaeon]
PYSDRRAEDLVRLGVVGKTNRGWIEIEVSLKDESAVLSKVESAIRASKHARDIIRIEPLGLFECCLVQIGERC